MVANIRGYTPNYGLKLINFDTPRWHTLEYSNWELVDAIMASTGLPGLRGEWINSTLYLVGERVFDNADGKIYGCLVSHTSAATGTFAADRAAHPTYWMLQTLDTPRYRGGWAPSVAYSIADIVFINSYTYYLCIAGHTSSSTFPPDAPKWTLVFDATAAVNSTNASATAAAGSATQAATSATNAATSASQSAASAVESAQQASKLFGTSVSSVVVGLGGKTFITQADKYFNVGKFIMVRANASPVDNWMWGQVTSYAGTSLVVNALTSGGSGTFADWIIDVSGSRGAIGPQGPIGETGAGLIIKGTVPSDENLPPTGNTIGDAYVAEDNNHLYIWDGTEWDDAGILGTSITTTADVAPTNSKDGDMWWESDKGILWIWYDDGTSGQWVQTGGNASIINQSFVLKTGDTMSGDLIIERASPSVLLNTTGNGQALITYYRAGSVRWLSGMQSGLNDYIISRCNDAGAYIDTPVTVSRATGATTLAGEVIINGNTAGGYGRLRINDAGGSFNSALTFQHGGAIGWEITQAANNDLKFGRLPTHLGSVFIEQTTPSSSPATGALIVNGGVGVGESLNVASNTGIGAAAGSLPGAGNTNTGISLFAQGFVCISRSTASALNLNQNVDGITQVFNRSGTMAGNIAITSTTTAYNTSSDARLKEDLKSFDAGNIIDDTEVYDFKWKETGERAFGVVAQQAAEIYDTPTFYDKDSDRWFVDYSKYVPVLLQELKALRARVAILEGRTSEAPKRKK